MKSIISSLSVMTFFLFLFFFSTLAGAAPVPLLPIDNKSARDVFVPPVLLPNSQSVWKIGTTQTVQWDVSHPPKQITNGKAMVVLVKDGLLDIDHPLATDIDVLKGHTQVTVPAVEEGEYQILVFGDSGNTGEHFMITN